MQHRSGADLCCWNHPVRLSSLSVEPPRASKQRKWLYLRINYISEIKPKNIDVVIIKHTEAEVLPDSGGLGVLITERPAALLWLVIDFAGWHWPTLWMKRGTSAAFVTGRAAQAALGDTVNRCGWAGPSVFSAGSLMSIAVDCSSKGRAICQRCHKKGGSTLEPSRASSVSPSHTHALYTEHIQALTFLFFSFAVAAKRNWALIGCSVPPKCDSKIQCREWQTGREDPVFDPQKSSEPPMGSLSCCAEHLLWCWINYWPAWTNSWRRERESLKSDLWEMCSCGLSIWIFGDLFHGN